MKNRFVALARSLIIILSMLLLFSLACKNLALDGENVLPLEGRILFYFFPSNNQSSVNHETLGLQLLLRTEKFYGCANFGISSELTNKPANRATVSIDGIIPPEICLPAFGPATAEHPLVFSSDNTILLFTYGREIDWYFIAVTDTGLVVEAIKSSFTAYSPLN